MSSLGFSEFLSFAAAILFFVGLILFIFRIFDQRFFFFASLMLFIAATATFVEVITGATNLLNFVADGLVRLTMAVIAWLELLALVKIDKERQLPF